MDAQKEIALVGLINQHNGVYFASDENIGSARHFQQHTAAVAADNLCYKLYSFCFYGII
jgi:hypothetical protein